MLKVVAYLIERGDCEELHQIIKQQGRQIDRIQGRRPRARLALDPDGGVTAWPRSRTDRRDLPEQCASCSNPRPREAV